MERDVRGLSGKTSVIAGGATGIGAETARRLAKESANVVGGDINLQGAQTTQQNIEQAGGTALAVQFDLADDTSVQRLVDASLSQFGTINGLYNVGADLSPNTIGRDKTPLDTDIDVWTRACSDSFAPAAPRRVHLPPAPRQQDRKLRHRLQPNHQTLPMYLQRPTTQSDMNPSRTKAELH
ncbi:SDR family NAD(P)-dependent oxidoreductase [Phytohabitans suffuscus]|uniref:Uncharacterized protein n=1 Tax=Phytohabitans suffuscus TaxID=624315 RepID=A0A6F8YS56_9ACTN|nr:SDR family NAD(P)-dependent oxidoreductase [Phytohabitans suffuscus]BCB88768.1 hypothetical protein Psuf_060810 [Phytohabitans suffuscus]